MGGTNGNGNGNGGVLAQVAKYGLSTVFACILLYVVLDKWNKADARLDKEHEQRNVMIDEQRKGVEEQKKTTQAIQSFSGGQVVVIEELRRLNEAKQEMINSNNEQWQLRRKEYEDMKTLIEGLRK